MDEECASAAARYGVALDAALITGIDPPSEVDSALAAINTAHNHVSSEISLAQARQISARSRSAVQIETSMRNRGGTLLALAGSEGTGGRGGPAAVGATFETRSCDVRAPRPGILWTEERKGADEFSGSLGGDVFAFSSWSTGSRSRAGSPLRHRSRARTSCSSFPEVRSVSSSPASMPMAQHGAPRCSCRSSGRSASWISHDQTYLVVSP